MILFIFRFVTLLSLVGLIAFLLLGQFDTSSVKSDVEQTKVRLNQLSLQLEIDKNESEAALSGLYRARGDFRDKEDGFLGQIKDLKSQIDGFVPRQTEIEKEKDDKAGELKQLETKLLSALAPLEKIESEKKPLEEKRKRLEDEKSKILQTLLSHKKEADEKALELSNLEAKRNIAKESFDEDLNRLMEGIKKPFHLYYAEPKEVTIASRAPSGKGIFINFGYLEGLRTGMEFLTKNEGATSNLSFRLQAALVQKNFSYLEFLDATQVTDPSYATEGQKLTLIRSGNFILDENSSEVLTNSK